MVENLDKISIKLKNLFYEISTRLIFVLDNLCDNFIYNDRSLRFKIVELLVIKYLYIFLVILILGDAWYQGYGGYGIDFKWWKEVFSCLAFVIISNFYLRYPIENSLLKQLLHCLFVLYYIPLNSAFALNNAGWGFFFLSNTYFLLIYIVTYFVSERLCQGKLDTANKNTENFVFGYDHHLINIFCFFICSLFILHKLFYNGLDFSLSIGGDDVYLNRAAYVDYLDGISGTLFSYVLAIVRYLVTYVAPFYLLSGLIRKKPIAIAMGLLCTLSMFAVSSEKGKLLMPIIAIFIYVLYRMKLLKSFDRIVSCGILFLLIICLCSHIVGNDSLFLLIVRREMYIPAWLNNLYYDFFSSNPKIMWTQSTFILQKVFQPIYDSSPLSLISNTYFQGTIPSPNTGMFADAYMHFGFLGVLLYPVLFALFFSLSSRIFNSYGSAFQTLFAVQVTLTLTNVSLLRTDFVLSVMLFVFLLAVLPLIDDRLKKENYVKKDVYRKYGQYRR